LENVKAELAERGIEAEAVAKLEPILTLSGSTAEKLAQLEGILAESETGLKGVEELRTVFSSIEALGIALEVELDLSLARGLNYYTGAIFEVKAKDFAIGSICGGGRYDNLTGIFGMPDVSGVGISFGADRIYDVMVGLDLFPADVTCLTKVLFINLGEAEALASLRCAKLLRDGGIATEVYPDSAKMKKQMEYANRRQIPYVVIIGSNELAEGKATVKNMTSGEQSLVTFDEIADLIK
jgi:histidyl-tRNA synthetase